MENTINLMVTKTELAAIISALDFVLIENLNEQFTQDEETLTVLYGALDRAFGDDDDALLQNAKSLAQKLTDVFTSVAA